MCEPPSFKLNIATYSQYANRQKLKTPKTTTLKRTTLIFTLVSANTFGEIFRVTTFGESHGPGIGAVIEGIPAGLKLDLNQIQAELNRRRPGQSNITSQRKEADEFQILSYQRQAPSCAHYLQLIQVA